MKVTIDTEEKTLLFEEEINLKEAVETIKTLLKDWKDYKIVPNNDNGVRWITYNPVSSGFDKIDDSEKFHITC